MTYLDSCFPLNLSVAPCLPINSITTLHPMSGIWELVPHKWHGSTSPFMLKHVQHRWHLSHSSSLLSGNLSPLICSCLVLISFSAGIIKLSRNTSVVCVVFFQMHLSFHWFHRYYDYSLWLSTRLCLVNNKSITANVFCLSLMSCLNAREHPWSVMYACSIPVFHRTEF